MAPDDFLIRRKSDGCYANGRANKTSSSDYLLLFKVGMFYDTYGKDSYIIAGNFDYSQNTVNGIQKCGFSRKSITEKL